MVKLKDNRKDALKCTDERLKLTQEALSGKLTITMRLHMVLCVCILIPTVHAPTGIRIVKFMTWEESLTAKIDRVRSKELTLLRVAAIYKALNFTLMASSPMIICIVTLTVYGALGGELTASYAVNPVTNKMFANSLVFHECPCHAGRPSPRFLS